MGQPEAYEKYLQYSLKPASLTTYQALKSPTNYQEIEGDLVQFAKEGFFDVITHGANCFCRMKRGIAVAMNDAFGCSSFPLEDLRHIGDYNKLGQIDYGLLIKVISGLGGAYISAPHLNLDEGQAANLLQVYKDRKMHALFVVNSYTQYRWGTDLKPFDYDAFALCLKKLNYIFRGLHIGLPQIGSHLAGGDWNLIKPMIQKYLSNSKVTVVIYKL